MAGMGTEFSSTNMHVTIFINLFNTDRDVACQIQAKELANQLTDDAAMAADLVNRELMDEILAKDIAEKEQSKQLDEQKQFEKLQVIVKVSHTFV